LFEKHNIVIVYGPKRSGKSIFVQFFLDILKREAKYITAINIIMELYGRDFEEKKDYLDELYKYNFLGIDDIDKVKLTGWKEEMMFYLIDKRISNLKKTIISCSVVPERLHLILGNNIADKLLSEAYVIKLNENEYTNEK